MLTPTLIKKIEEFVYAKPRSIQEIALHIQKNWRTANRYIAEIEKNYGTLAIRVFREGTRGALKIVYWASIEKISSSVFQEKIEEEIFRAKRKEDFSAFDIFQFVPDAKKEARVETEQSEQQLGFQNIYSLFQKAEKQLLIFSGNLSFISFRKRATTILQVLENVIKKGIPVKILCRIDIAGKKAAEDVLALNFKHGRELIEIRHREHPLRATIVDNKMFHMKEIKEPTGKLGELDKKLFIFYTIKDKEWTEWLARIFWKMFSFSVDAKKRLQELQKLK